MSSHSQYPKSSTTSEFPSPEDEPSVVQQGGAPSSATILNSPISKQSSMKNIPTKSSLANTALPTEQNSREDGQAVLQDGGARSSATTMMKTSPTSKRSSMKNITAKSSLSNSALPTERNSSNVNNDGSKSKVSLPIKKSTSGNVAASKRVSSGSVTVIKGTPSETTPFQGETETSNVIDSLSTTSLHEKKTSTENVPMLTHSITLVTTESNATVLGDTKNMSIQKSTSNISIDSREDFINSLQDGRRSTRRTIKKQPSNHSNLGSCQRLRMNPSIDKLHNAIERPKTPTKYNPPFRRNFRYFGYPEDLNLDMNTPPRVRSWGPIVEPSSSVKPTRRRFTVSPEAFVPGWMGDVLKNSTLLQNPALLPVLQKNKAVGKLGRKPVKLVKPDLEVTDCVSQLYFPMGEKSRQAFCRINKRIQENIDKQIHEFAVQHHTSVVQKSTEQQVEDDDGIMKRRMTRAGRNKKKTRRTSRFSLADFQLKTTHDRFYQHRDAPLVMKSFCLPKLYPGQNRQLYGRPAGLDEANYEEQEASKTEEVPVTGVVKIPEYTSPISGDIWEKIYKARARQKLHKKSQIRSHATSKFRVFDQLELRNQVLETTKDRFIDNLKKNINAPLPPELYKNNRGLEQPPHDYSKGEYPAQGPFWWKPKPEGPPTEQELRVVDAYIDELKELRISHHLPGLFHAPRHPFEPFELDWIQEGCEMKNKNELRKTPTKIQKLPDYIMNLDAQNLQDMLERMLNEKAKDLVGSRMYAMHKQSGGSKSLLKNYSQSTIDIPSERESLPEIKGCKVLEDIPLEHSDSQSDEEDGIEIFEEDLEEDEQFPLPNIRFSHIDFPEEDVPEHLKQEIGFYNEALGRTLPLKKKEEEVKEEESESDTTTSEEELEGKESKPELTVESVAPNQFLYKHKPQQPRKSARFDDVLVRAGLRHIFDEDGDTNDVDQMWKQTEENKSKQFTRYFDY